MPVWTEVPSMAGPPNPFLLNALKLFHWSSLKAQSRHGMWTPLEGSTQLPRLQAGRRHSLFDEGGLRDLSKCPSCLLRGVCKAPQGGCQLQTHRFFLSPLMKLLSSVPSLSVCWTLSMCQALLHNLSHFIILNFHNLPFLGVTGMTKAPCDLLNTVLGRTQQDS